MRVRSKFLPTPQPSAVTRSASSLFSSTFAVDTPSVFSTLPRSGRIAWRARSRPCFAEPPAESPSTTNSSLVIDPGLVQSASLPGRLTRPAVGPLRTTSACAARLASRARADRMMRATIASAIDWLLFSQCSRPGPHQAVDRRHHFGIVEAILGLALELRLLDEHRQDAGHAFANVFGGERHALRRQVVRLDVIADRLAEPGAQAVLVRAARSGRDAVDVAAQVLVGRFGPLQDELDLDAVLFLERERRFVHRLGVPLGDDLLQVVDEAFFVLEHVLLAGGLVLERDLDAAMQVAGDLEPLADHLRVELDLRENLRVGLEEHRRAGAARRADLLQAAGRLALLEGHLGTDGRRA